MIKLIKIARSSFLASLFFVGALAGDDKYSKDRVSDPFRTTSTARIGDNPFPTNPMNDRAIGYLLQGKINNAVSNYGSFINWDEQPSGLWGDYAYLPAVAFLAGVPGHSRSSEYQWQSIDYVDEDGDGLTDYSIWESTSAYDAWFEDNGDTVFVGILYDAEEDFGRWEPDSVAKKYSLNSLLAPFQWMIDSDNSKILITTLGELNPNEPSSRIGLIYPWALRPKLKSREDQFDFYDYGQDQEEWTDDDDYFYYGATASESWFTRLDPTYNTDWHASTKSRVNTHNTEVTAGDLFGNTYVTDSEDTYPLLAHSDYSTTWPKRFNSDLGIEESFWPGWWSEDYNTFLPGCEGSRKDPDCWEEVPGRFVSDMDVYMEFDDRWAHRGNVVNTNNEYETTGYPTGLRVMSTAHSYGVSYAEDVMFVTVKVRNESGDFCAEDEYGNPVLDSEGNQICGDGMIMPDGTKLNRGKGFNYKGMSLGFYMDADVLVGDRTGYDSFYHTNDDDFMKYYDSVFTINNERLRVSMAMVGDYDGLSGVPGYSMKDQGNVGNNFGIVATQLLDSPLSTKEIDLDKNGTIDIFPNEPLKMTDWHWFDWYSRPGVTQAEGNSSGCYAGASGCPQARNKEEILYKLMIGDTTNLQADEHEWYFHTEDPASDLGRNLNPHFDSLEGLLDEPAFLRDPDGLDCVLILSCGPFDLPVGREVPFSFCIIFGQNEEDLINNAKFAQVMYNSRYQGFTPPSRPKVHVESELGTVKLYWNNQAETSTDVVTGYADFEGYKIYKSEDGGSTWGKPDAMIYDTDGIFVGWRPYKQYDLSAEEDSLHCTYYNPKSDSATFYDNKIIYDSVSGQSDTVRCEKKLTRGHSIRGQDPYFPWFSLGDDTGFEEVRLAEPYIVEGDTFHYMIEDKDVVDGFEYTYSVVAYDMGVERPVNTVYEPIGNGQYIAVSDTNNSNPDEWASPDGYAYIENSRGTTVLDRNFVKVYPGVQPQQNLDKVKVVPNPYVVRSKYGEQEFLKQIRFTYLPDNCTISIFTVTGEFVHSFKHESYTSGNAIWDLRTINNQEIAPGLYIYHIKSSSDEKVGKFAVIR